MVGTPDLNPDEYCIRCQRAFYPTDEECRHCGFDPINDDEAANELEISKYLWSTRHLSDEPIPTRGVAHHPEDE